MQLREYRASVWRALKVGETLLEMCVSQPLNRRYCIEVRSPNLSECVPPYASEAAVALDELLMHGFGVGWSLEPCGSLVYNGITIAYIYIIQLLHNVLTKVNMVNRHPAPCHRSTSLKALTPWHR